MSGIKLLSVRQVSERVPNADGAWLRWRISQRAVRSLKIGYHLLVPESELPKIARLAACRRKSR